MAGTAGMPAAEMPWRCQIDEALSSRNDKLFLFIYEDNLCRRRCLVTFNDKKEHFLFKLVVTKHEEKTDDNRVVRLFGI
jgi:hypothetical protein